jgi:hypothetical protein
MYVVIPAVQNVTGIITNHFNKQTVLLLLLLLLLLLFRQFYIIPFYTQL